MTEARARAHGAELVIGDPRAAPGRRGPRTRVAVLAGSRADDRWELASIGRIALHRRSPVIARSAAIALAAVLVACGHEEAAGAKVESAVASELVDASSDDRVAYLLAPCPRSDPFLEDTSNMIPVLVSKVAGGQLEPQKRAKEELADLGATAVPELSRILEENFKRPDGSQRVQNVLSVAALMDSDAGRDLFLRGLEHPQESVRIAAVRGLEKHAKSEDYDRLRALLPIASRELGIALGPTLFASDRARYELDALEWIGEHTYAPLWTGLLERIAETDQPAAVARAREIVPDADNATAPFLNAILARAGDPQALAALRVDLAADNPARRQLAIRALDRAGKVSEFAPLAKSDRDPKVRLAAATAIAERPLAEETHAVLVPASADASRDVRKVSLAARVHARDASAIEQALELLKGDRLDLEMALGILRDLWLEDPKAAERALGILQGLWAGEIQPQRVDQQALARAIGQVPLESAARWLYDLARGAEGTIQNLRAHRWYLVHAGNTGVVGRAYLRTRWSEESDPLRRMDIVTATSYDHTDDERVFLTGVIENSRTTPIELLHAADVLVNLGPSGYTAPFLKRVVIGVADARVRPALNCLMWKWFGRDE